MSNNQNGLSGRGVTTLNTVIGTVTDADIKKHAGDGRIDLSTRLDLLQASSLRNRALNRGSIKKQNIGKHVANTLVKKNHKLSKTDKTHVSYNHAFLFLKPNYTTKHIKYMVEEIFQYQNIKVLQSGTISTAEIIRRSLFKNQYSYISQYIDLPSDELYYDTFIKENEVQQIEESNFLDEAALAMQIAVENAKKLAAAAQGRADASIDSASTAMSSMLEKAKSLGVKAVHHAQEASSKISAKDITSKASGMYNKAKDAAQVVTTKALHLVDDIVDVDLDDMKSLANSAKSLASNAKQKAINFDASSALNTAVDKAKEASAVAAAAASTAASAASNLSLKLMTDTEEADETDQDVKNLPVETPKPLETVVEMEAPEVYENKEPIPCIMMTQEEQFQFYDAYKTGWNKCKKDRVVFTPVQLLQRWKISPRELYDIWKAGKQIKIRKGLHISRIVIEDIPQEPKVKEIEIPPEPVIDLAETLKASVSVSAEVNNKLKILQGMMSGGPKFDKKTGKSGKESKGGSSSSKSMKSNSSKGEIKSSFSTDAEDKMDRNSPISPSGKLNRLNSEKSTGDLKKKRKLIPIKQEYYYIINGFYPLMQEEYFNMPISDMYMHREGLDGGLEDTSAAVESRIGVQDISNSGVLYYVVEWNGAEMLKPSNVDASTHSDNTGAVALNKTESYLKQRLPVSVHKQELLSWDVFRKRIIGDTDPAVADPASIRGRVFRSHAWLVEQQIMDHTAAEQRIVKKNSDYEPKSIKPMPKPDKMYNVMHCCGSAFEGLVERLTWLYEVNSSFYESEIAKRHKQLLLMTEKALHKPIAYGETEFAMDQIPCDSMQSRNATGFAFYGKSPITTGAWDSSDPKRTQLLADRANRLGIGNVTAYDQDWTGGEEKGHWDSYGTEPHLEELECKADSQEETQRENDYGRADGAEYKADELEAGSEVHYSGDYPCQNENYGVAAYGADFQCQSDQGQEYNSPEYQEDVGNGSQCPDSPGWRDPYPGTSFEPDATFTVDMNASVSVQEHLLSLYRDPFALNLVQHNGTTSASTSNDFIRNSGQVKTTRIPTYNCALPVELIWEWVTNNPVVTSEKEGLDTTCGTPYSTAAAIRAITANSTSLTSTNISKFETCSEDVTEFVEKVDKTPQETRQFQIIYGVKTVLEHMRGLGNDDCIKKAIELYQMSGAGSKHIGNPEELHKTLQNSGAFDCIYDDQVMGYANSYLTGDSAHSNAEGCEFGGVEDKHNDIIFYNESEKVSALQLDRNRTDSEESEEDSNLNTNQKQMKINESSVHTNTTTLRDLAFYGDDSPKTSRIRNPGVSMKSESKTIGSWGSRPGTPGLSKIASLTSTVAEATPDMQHNMMLQYQRDHMNFNTHGNKNSALLFIKPNANTKAVYKYIKEILDVPGMAIIQSGEFRNNYEDIYRHPLDVEDEKQTQEIVMKGDSAGNSVVAGGSTTSQRSRSSQISKKKDKKLPSIVTCSKKTIKECFDKQYAHLVRRDHSTINTHPSSISSLRAKMMYKDRFLSCSREGVIEIDDLQKESFNKFYEANWDEELDNGSIYCPSDVLVALHTQFPNAKALHECWMLEAYEHGGMLTLSRGFSICRIIRVLIDPKSNPKRPTEIKTPIYVINGFYPYMKELYSDPSASMRYMVLEWSDVDRIGGSGFGVKYADFLNLVIGNSNPRQAHSVSIRHSLYVDWDEYELPTQPNRFDNCLHVSKSCFEGLVERSIWLSDIPTDTEFKDALFVSTGMCVGTVTGDSLLGKGMKHQHSTSSINSNRLGLDSHQVLPPIGKPPVKRNEDHKHRPDTAETDHSDCVETVRTAAKSDTEQASAITDPVPEHMVRGSELDQELHDDHSHSRPGSQHDDHSHSRPGSQRYNKVRVPVAETLSMKIKANAHVGLPFVQPLKRISRFILGDTFAQQLIAIIQKKDVKLTMPNAAVSPSIIFQIQRWMENPEILIDFEVPRPRSPPPPAGMFNRKQLLEIEAQRQRDVESGLIPTTVTVKKKISLFDYLFELGCNECINKLLDTESYSLC